METKLHKTVDDFFKAILPLIDEPHQRIDDRQARVMGRAWIEKGVAHLIGVDDFKATGDAPRFQELWEERFGKDRKPRPEYEPPEAEAAEPGETVH